MITGCDSGFGNLLARRLDNAGFKVYACCLFENGPGAKQLESDCSSRLTILKLDVTSDKDVDLVYRRVEKDLEESGYCKLNTSLMVNQWFKYYCLVLIFLCSALHAVVNNAGILSTGEIEFGQDIDSCEKQISVNCLGTIRVTKGFTPLLRRCKALPRLVNITSMAARVSLPGKQS